MGRDARLRCQPPAITRHLRRPWRARIRGLQRRLRRPSGRRRTRVLPRAPPGQGPGGPRRLRHRRSLRESDSRANRRRPPESDPCPSSHSFVDGRHFTSAPVQGQRIPANDDRLTGLRKACGEEDWAEAGFIFDRGVVYATETNGQVVAAENLTPFRRHFADVGLITHPDHRGQGLATRLASRMIADALPEAGVVRYRALTANAPSGAVARSLGFVARGENLVARLRQAAVE